MWKQCSFQFVHNSNLTGWWLPMLTKFITLIYLDSWHTQILIAIIIIEKDVHLLVVTFPLVYTTIMNLWYTICSLKNWKLLVMLDDYKVLHYPFLISTIQSHDDTLELNVAHTLKDKESNNGLHWGINWWVKPPITITREIKKTIKTGKFIKFHCQPKWQENI